LNHGAPALAAGAAIAPPPQEPLDGAVATGSLEMENGRLVIPPGDRLRRHGRGQGRQTHGDGKRAGSSTRAEVMRAAANRLRAGDRSVALVVSVTADHHPG
jgi:hypothetical protein